MKKIIFFLIAAAVLPLAAQRTTRRNLHAQEAAEPAAAAAVFDTVVPAEPHLVNVNGYDKPLRSRRETFFATNNGKRHIGAIAFTIKYYDTSNRLLHSVSHNLPAAIPPAETRQLSVRSWDVQNTFYYHRSAVPERAAQATPYDVSITVDTIFYAKL